MRDYFIRRLLLIPPTLLGITIIVFIITRLVPGGPIERAIMEAQLAGGQRAVAGQNMALSEAQLDRLRQVAARLSACTLDRGSSPAKTSCPV